MIDARCIMAQVEPFPGWAGALAAVDPDRLAPAGLEDDPHVTLLHGLLGPLPCGLMPVARALRAVLGDEVVLAPQATVFENPSFDVVKLSVFSPSVMAARAALATLPHVSHWPAYEPHLTLAYVESGAGARYREEIRFPSPPVARITGYSVSGPGGKRYAYPA